MAETFRLYLSDLHMRCPGLFDIAKLCFLAALAVLDAFLVKHIISSLPRLF
jgi:hypothetical protein